jgi:hypothetical protein
MSHSGRESIRCCAATLALAAALAALTSRAEAEANRFVAEWADGTTTTADEVIGWNGKREPSIDGAKLLRASNPIRSLQNTSLEHFPRAGRFIEFVGGDRLPGKVVGYQRATDTPQARTPAHLVFEPDFHAAGAKPLQSSLRILAPGLRRVVFEHRDVDRYQPATLFHRDGRQIAFRSIRWNEDGVRLLLEEGTVQVPLDHILELHMPRADAWETHLDRLVKFKAAKDTRLVQVETSSGAVVTATLPRFSASGAEQADASQTWVHRLRPVWSPDPVAVAFRDVRTWRFFAVHEMPLTWLDCVASPGRSAFGATWRDVRLDRNVEGGPLECGDRAFAWGIGVHAPTELQYAMPSFVASMRTKMGLDRAIGNGGCARGTLAVLDDEPDKALTLYRSELVIGSSHVIDTERLLAPKLGPTPKLLLIVDAAARPEDGAPPDADPFDIRDHWDWLEPMLELDPVALEAELARRAVATAPPKN